MIMDWSIAQINLLGEWLFYRLGRISIELIILAVLIFGILWVVRVKSPKVRYWFCCLILVKPLAAILITSPISLYWFLSPEPEKIPEPPPITEQYVAVEQLPPVNYSRRPNFRRPSYRSELHVPPPTPWWKELNIDSYITFVWLVIMVIFGVRLLVGCVYVHLLCARAKELPSGPERELLDRARKLMNMSRKVRVAVSSQVATPILAGIFRPLILMPEGFRDNLSLRQIEMIFAHELGHIKRWDNLVLLLQRIAEMFLFYHPVVWICGHVLRTEAEKACDDLVLANYGDGAEYAASLASAAEMRDKLTRRLLINTFAASESCLTMRVRRILEGRRGKTMIWISVMTVAALVAVAVFGLPSAAEREEKTEIILKQGEMKMGNKPMKLIKVGSRRYIADIAKGKIPDNWNKLVEGMRIILKSRGEKVTSDELLAVSGDAFNLCHATNWELRIPLSVPVDTMSAIAKAYGYQSAWTDSEWGFKLKRLDDKTKQQVREKYLKRIFKAIDSGHPVLFGGCYGNCGDWRVLTGYDRKNKKICLSGGETPDDWTDTIDPKVKEIGYWDMQVRGAIKPNFYGGWHGNASFILGNKEKKVSEKDRALATLKQAVKIFNAPNYTTKGYGGETYYFGGNAYRALAENFQTLDYPADLGKERAKGNPYGFYDVNNLITQADQLVRGRNAAAKFCEKAAKLFPDSEKALLKATENYRKEAALAEKTFAVFMKTSEGRKDEKIWRDAMLTPEAKRWLSSKTNRENAAKAILRMFKYDQAAVGKIKKVLVANNLGILTEGKSQPTIQDGKIWLDKVFMNKTGNLCQWDAILRGLQAILKYRGTDASLNDLMAYSGDAFNLCHGSNWQGVAYLQVPTNPVKNIADAYGYEYSCLHDGYGVEKLEKLKPEERQKYTKIILRKIAGEIDAERPVLAGGCIDGCGDWLVITGYDRKQPALRYFKANGKPVWDVVRGFPGNPQYSDDSGRGVIGHWNGRFRGTIRPGFTGGWQNNPAYLIGKKTSAPAEKENILNVLKRAVELFNAPEQHISWWGGVDYYFGRQAYEKWAEELDELDYPADLKKELQKDAYDWYSMGNMDTQVDQIIQGRTAAAEFCLKAAKKFPELKPYLVKAAENYKKEVAIAKKEFAVFIPPWDNKDKKRKTWLSNETKREQGVKAIRKMLKYDQVAVGEIAKILKAEGVEISTPSVKVKKIGKETVIENVPRPKGTNSVLASLAAILKTQEPDITYEYLMGVSSRAFRLQFSWCPSAPHSLIGFNTYQPALKAAGYKETEFPVGLKKETVKPGREAVKKSINAGMPCMFGSEEAGVIAGYEPISKENSTGWLRRPGSIGGPKKKDEPYLLPVKRMPWGVSVYSRTNKPPRTESIVWSLRTGVRNAHAGKYNGKLAIGFEAWDKWIKDLRNFGPIVKGTIAELAKHKRPHSEKAALFGICLGNSWCYESLVDARKAAAKYLDSIAGEFKPEAAKHLKKAAGNYRKLVKALTPERTGKIAPYPFGMKDIKKQWTNAMRKKQADIMEKALPYEQQAIAEIEAALKAEGIELKKAGIQTRIDLPAPPKEPGNTYARGMSAVLSYLGKKISYDQVMGLSGVAFILQIDTSGPYIGKELDCAWWPNDAWGFNLGLPVLAKAAGREIRKINCDDKAYKANPATEYARVFAPAIKKSLEKGLPVLAEYDHCFIVTSIDNESPPLLGYGSRMPSTRYEGIIRIQGYPWGIIVFGEKTASESQAEVDLASLRHIVALFDGQVRDSMSKTRFSGKQAWKEWLKLLHKRMGCDNNMLIHLRYNRHSAIAYLREMAKRFTGKSREHLNAAADLYQQELGLLMKQGLPWNMVRNGKSEQEVNAEFTAMAEQSFKLETKAIAEIKVVLKAEKIDVKKASSPDKHNSSVILENVPRVGFYQGPGKGNPEDHPLPSVMRSVMEYFGDDLGVKGFKDHRGGWQWDTCAMFHGITGSGFAFSWEHPYGESYLGKDLMKSYDNSFAFAGYDQQTILRPDFAAKMNFSGRVSNDENEYRRLIVESIRDRRLPVLAIGVLGPDEPCLICGYEQNGKVIIGWNYFQDEHRKDPRLSFDKAGRFVLRDWFRDTRGIILPGNKLPKPPDSRKMYREALLRDLALLCNSGGKGNRMGVAAYQDWIDYLLKPIPKPAADDPRKIKPFYKRHNEMIGELAERRAYASTFLYNVADVTPAAVSVLRQAGYCHMAMHDILWRVWQTLGAWNRTDDAKLLRYGDPKYRKELASLVRRLQAWDLEAAINIRKALIQMGVSGSELPGLPEIKPVKGLRDLGVESCLPGSLGHSRDNAAVEITGLPVFDEKDGLAGAVKAATAVTDWPITGTLSKTEELTSWTAKNGWQLKIIKKPFNETKLAAAKRINDVILSCLYGLPVVTTYKGKPAVVVGYNHLAGQSFRVCLPEQKSQTTEKISINDKDWGPAWVFMAGRLESAGNKEEVAKTKNMKDKIMDTKNKIIAGVPAISWGQTGDCSFAAALSAALDPTKHPYSYTDIMGYSALAFRVRWRGLKNRKNKAWWCGSIPVGELKEEVDRTADMTGWQLSCTGMLDNNPEKLKEYFPEVIKSINEGLPVIGYPTGKNLNCGTIYGYVMKNGKTEFYWRDLFKGDKKYLQSADDTGPFLIFLKSWKRPAARKDRLVDSLKQAVVNWSRGPIGTPKYYTWSYGREAMELWIKDLRNAARFSKEQQKELFFVNAWNYQTLADARKHAVKYLKENAKLLPEPARKHLDRAEELYRQEVEILNSVPGTFRGPMGGKKLEKWTPADRKREAEILSKALKLEQQAIAEIEAALKTAGIKIDNPAKTVAVDKNYAKKMLRWQNIFGWTLEKCEKGVVEHPEIQKLNKLETSIEPLSPQAESVRQRMLGLEPAMIGYQSNVEALLNAIGKRKPLKKLPYKGLSEQQKKIKEYVKTLKLWLAGVKEPNATMVKGIPLECVSNVYNYLGDPGRTDKEKRQLAELLIQSLEKGVDKKTADKLKKLEKLKEMVHRIENPGKELWSFENNFRLLTKSIGQKKPVGEWHKPGGPLCWSDGNPEDLKPLAETIKNLQAWIAGKPVPEAFARQMGKPNAYKEKLWLAKSLLVYLKNNQQGYYKPEFAVSPHDFSKLKPGWSMDAFAQAVYESAKLLGKRPDLLTMQAMTTNAFASAVNPEEDCSAWWHVQSLDRGRKLVEDRFGLKIQLLKTKAPKNIPPKPKNPEKLREWLAEYYRKPYVKEIQKHLKAGSLVIIDMVWDWKHHGNAWVNWGIVTEANADGTIKGTGVNGRIDNPLLSLRNAYVISPGKVKLTPERADIEMLKQAVLRIKGEQQPFGPEKGALFGVKAMDEWINRMKTVPGFCVPCEKVKRGWSCAEACAIPLSAGAKNAAAYLKKRLNSFPAQMRPHLKKAVAHYENIAKLLAPALDKKAKTHYRHFVGNLKKQQTYASNVLEKVKAEFAAAGNEIELALHSEGIKNE